MLICGARFVAGLGNGFHDHVERFFVGFEIGGEAAFVAHRGGVAALLEHAFQGVEDFGAHADGFGKFRRAMRDDHEFLRVDGVVGVRASIEDIHLGNGQQVSADAPQISIERRLSGLCGGACGGHRDRQDRVGAQLALVGRAVQIDQLAVEGGLLVSVHADDGRRNLLVDILYRLARALPEVALGIVIAQLHSFVFAGGSSGGNGGAPNGAI